MGDLQDSSPSFSRHPGLVPGSTVPHRPEEACAARWMPGRVRHDGGRGDCPYSRLSCRSPLPLPLVLGAISALGFPPWNALAATLIAVAIWLHLVHEPRPCAACWHRLAVRRRAFLHRQRLDPAAVRVPGRDAALARLSRGAARCRSISRSTRCSPPASPGGFASPAAKGDPAPGADAAFVLIAGAAGWSTEYLRGTMFTGYPWDPLSLVLVPATVRSPRGLSAPMRCRVWSSSRRAR